MINIIDFDARLLKIVKKSYKNIGIYNIGCITKKKIDDYQNIYSLNSLYPIVTNASGYIEEQDLNTFYLNIDHVRGYIKEKSVNNNLVIDSTHENKELLKKCSDVWNGIKNKIKEVNDSECDYEKYYMKIKLNFDDNLPLKKPLKFHNMTITIQSVFEEDGKLYPQLFLDDTLYELDA